MIKRIVFSIAVLIFSLGLSAPVLAAEPGVGVIQGQLVNKTAGGGSVAAQVVTLKTYVDNAEASSATATTDNEGRFTFSGLVTSPGNSYDATVTYQGAEYTGERLSFGEGKTAKTTELAVYDSTQSSEAIRMPAVHTIVYLGEGRLEVIEYYLFVNESDRTYIGFGEITATGTRRTLRLPLPAKASGLQYDGELMECCVLPDGDGFYDTMPVMPGEKWLAYSYQIKTGGQYTFSRKVDFPASAYNFLVQGERTQVSANGLSSQGVVDFEGNKFQYYSGADLALGDTITVNLSGLPRGNNQVILVSVVLALVALGGAVAVLLVRRGPLQPVRVGSGSDQLRQRLLLQIARLDDDFEAGKIDESAYRRQRAEKKSQLVRLTQSGKEKSGKR